MKRIKKQYGMFIVGLVVILSVFSYGLANAWFIESKIITNVFHTGTVHISFTEEFCAPKNWNPGDCTPKVLHINNIGTKAVYVRFKVTPSWTNNLPTSNVTFTVTNPNVIKIGDWYYYKKVLGAPLEMPGSPTCIVVNTKVCLSGPNTGNEYENQDYKLKIETEAVQAKNLAMVSQWQLTPAQLAQIGFQAYAN